MQACPSKTSAAKSASARRPKSKYGGLEACEHRWVKELESENAKLKRMYAELVLDNAAMKYLIAKKF